MGRATSALAVAGVASVGYAILLVALPSDVGLATPWFVLSPARALLALAVAAAAVDWLRHPAPRPVPPHLMIGAWLLFLACLGASTLANPAAGGAARWVSLAFEGAGVWGLGWWMVQRGRGDQIETALILATFGVAVVVLVTAAISMGYHDLAHGHLTSVGGSRRFGIARQQGPFDAPLFYAIWLVGPATLAFGRVLAAGGRRQIGWLVVWAVLAFGVLATVSRISIVAVPASMAAVLLAAHRPRLGAVSGAIALTVAVIAFAPGTLIQSSDSPPVAGPTSSPAVGGTAPPSGTASSPGATPASAVTPLTEADLISIEGSNAARLDAVVAAVRATAQRPLLGWGPLSAKPVASAMLGKTNYVDNTYLVILIEGGLLGLGSLLLLLFAAFRSTWRPARDPRATARIVAIGGIALLCGTAAFLSTSGGYACFWLLASLAARRRFPSPR